MSSKISVVCTLVLIFVVLDVSAFFKFSSHNKGESTPRLSKQTKKNLVKQILQELLSGYEHIYSEATMGIERIRNILGFKKVKHESVLEGEMAYAEMRKLELSLRIDDLRKKLYTM